MCPIEFSQKDYREVVIPPNSVIYCDPPYNSTVGYDSIFDHEAFYEWCRRQTHPIFISEYNMPQDFRCVAEKKRNVKFCAAGMKQSIEKIYTLS